MSAATRSAVFAGKIVPYDMTIAIIENSRDAMYRSNAPEGDHGAQM